MRILFLSALIFFLTSLADCDLVAKTSSSYRTSSQDKSSFTDYWLVEFSGQTYSSKSDFYFEPEENSNVQLNNYTFVEPRLEVGYRLFPALRQLPWDVTLDIYFDNNLEWDVSSEELNRLDWNNNYVYGPGLRLRKSFKPYFNDVTFIKDINLDLFAEYLKIHYLSKVHTSTTHRPREDVIYGVSFWSLFEGDAEEFDDNILNRLWAEIGAGYSHRRNNLYIKGFKNFNIVNSSATVGFRTFHKKLSETASRSFFDVYFKSKLEWDTGNNLWNKYEWNNNVKYGPGVNLVKYKYDTQTKTSKLAKQATFEIFFEYLMIDYLHKVEYIPSYRPDTDILFGIRFFILFGGKEIE